MKLLRYEGKRKKNLSEAILYRPQELNGSMRRKYPEDDIRHEMASIVTPRHVKSLVKSTSNNLYEYPIDGSPRVSALPSSVYISVSVSWSALLLVCLSNNLWHSRATLNDDAFDSKHYPHLGFNACNGDFVLFLILFFAVS